MKNPYTLFICYLIFISCNSGQKPIDLAEIQKMFNVTKGVKEIRTASKIFTTLEERSFSSKTIFKESGAPAETITYGKDGKIEKTEPWVSTNEKEFNGSEVKEEFDKDKRLIKRTIYNGGSVISQIQYKYDESGNKIEALEKDKKIGYRYLHNLLNEEITYNKAEDGKFYWYCKNKFNYNGKSDLIEMLVYYYPDDKTVRGKYLYKYDQRGSLIQTIGYDKNEIIEKTNRTIIYY